MPKREYYCPVEGEKFQKYADMDDHMTTKHPRDKIVPPDLDQTIRELGLKPEQERRLREQVQLQPPTPDPDEGVGWKPPAPPHNAPPGGAGRAAGAAGARVEWPLGKVEPRRSPVWGRLKRALELIRMNSEVKDAIWTMFTEEPVHYNNPTTMHSMMVNLGADAHKAHWLVQEAFKLTQTPEYGYPPAATYAYAEPSGPRSASSSSGSKTDEAGEIHELNREMNRAMMRWAMFLFQFRTMSQTLGPMMGGAGDRVPVLRMNPDGSPAKGEDGNYIFDHVPATRDAVQVGLQKAESVDPMKLATALQDSFGRGMDAMSKAIEFATPRQGGGASIEQWVDRTLALQSKVHDKDLEAVKAQWSAIREVSSEREKMLMQQLESLTPERQAETIKKWKSLGLLNVGDNLQATELQMKWEIAKMKRQDEKEVAMAQAQAQAVQAEADSRKFENLMNLATKTVTDAVKPVTSAIGDGLRARVSGQAPQNPAPAGNPQPQLPDFSSMTPEQRSAYRSNIARARELAAEAESRINAADNQG